MSQLIKMTLMREHSLDFKAGVCEAKDHDASEAGISGLACSVCRMLGQEQDKDAARQLVALTTAPSLRMVT